MRSILCCSAIIRVVASLIMMNTGSRIGAVLLHAGADVLLMMAMLSSQQLSLLSMKRKEKIMTDELKPTEEKKQKVEVKVQNNSDAVYGLGLIGAWVYFIGRATTPRERVEGFLKGLVWPAFLVYELFKFLHKE